MTTTATTTPSATTATTPGSRSADRLRPDPDFWDGLAEGYAAKPVDDPEAFERKIALARARIREDDLVLNIGCGTGSLSLRLADTGARLHGLDLSPEMIRIARAKVADAGVSNVEMHVGPFDETFDRFAEGTLDVVMGWSILHLLPKRTDAIAQMFRLLKPGGQLITSTVCLANSFMPLNALVALMRMFGKAPWVGSLSTEDLMEELQDAGFVDVSLHDVGAERTVAFITAVRPPLADDDP